MRVCGPCSASLDALDAAEAGSPGTRQGLLRGDDEDSEWGVIAGDTGVIPVDRQCQEQLAAVYVPVTGVDAPNLPRRGVESISAAAEGVSVYLRGTVDGCSRTGEGDLINHSNMCPRLQPLDIYGTLFCESLDLDSIGQPQPRNNTRVHVFRRL